ncbi:MAG: nucleoside monophosphate kinase [Alkalibacterium sp.]|nr:nucleoside monophosphate kinase [Alkalibacterium sp.]
MILILLGPPGSGKGTVAEKINVKHHFPVVSVGEMLRSEIKIGTQIGKKSSQYVSSGRLVPDDIINSLVIECIQKYNDEESIILDGYPRTLNQAWTLEEESENELMVFYLDVDKDILINRLLNRRRKDDTKETISQRFETYQNETQPLLEYYRKIEILVKVSGETSADIFQEIEKFL